MWRREIQVSMVLEVAAMVVAGCWCVSKWERWKRRGLQLIDCLNEAAVARFKLLPRYGRTSTPGGDAACGGISHILTLSGMVAGDENTNVAVHSLSISQLERAKLTFIPSNDEVNEEEIVNWVSK